MPAACDCEDHLKTGRKEKEGGRGVVTLGSKVKRINKMDTHRIFMNIFKKDFH